MDHSIDAASATEQLYALYKHDVYRYARFSLSDAQAAEDVVQEVFIKVFRSWNRFRGDSSPRTWVWKIVRSCIIDHARKRKHQLTQTEYDDNVGASNVPKVDEAMQMEETLQHLPANYREVVILRLLQNWSTSETASILGWSEPKVKTTLHRAVAQLRLLMNERECSNGLSRHPGTVDSTQRN